VRGEGAGNLSASKELTAAGAVIEGDFPRGQMLGQLGQSAAQTIYRKCARKYIHHTVSRKFDVMLWGGQFLLLPQSVQEERSRIG
jgi:hypothetical protein